MAMLTEVEQVANLFHVCAGNQRGVVQNALALLRLLRQDVAVISVLTLDLSRAGEREALLGRGIGLYFRHFFMYLVVSNLGTVCLRSLMYAV